jgi:acetyl-CoA carboxylase carboxyltransferase component
MITGFARLQAGRWALMAGDPMHYGGAWTARASEKITRFVDLAQVFHLPVVHLVDCPGFLIGPEAEKEGHDPLRHARGCRDPAIDACPWCSVIVRKVFGVAGALHQNSSRYGMRVAWPSAEWGSLPIAGGLEAPTAPRSRARPIRQPSAQK